MLHFRMFVIASDYEDAADGDEVRQDTLFKLPACTWPTATSSRPPNASAVSSPRRWLNTFQRRAVAELLIAFDCRPQTCSSLARVGALTNGDAMPAFT